MKARIEKFSDTGGRLPIQPTALRTPLNSRHGGVTLKAVYIYSDDWFSSIDIQRMSRAQECGFFRFLLAHSADVQGKLRSNDAEIGRITRMGTRGWREFKTRFSYLLTESEGFVWNPKQYEGWLKHENKMSAGRQGGLAKALAKAESARRSASGFQPKIASKPPTRLKDLKTKETSKSKERSLSLSLPEGISVAESSEPEPKVGQLWSERAPRDESDEKSVVILCVDTADNRVDFRPTDPADGDDTAMELHEFRQVYGYWCERENVSGIEQVLGNEGNSVAEKDGDSRPTEDPLFNRLYAWWKDCGGGCGKIKNAYQQYMSLREKLILESYWNPQAFERSWIANGWDAAYRAGRNPGELVNWLREYDPNGTAGEWKQRGSPQTTAERLASL